MKNTISTILLICIVQTLTFGQDINLPKEISIIDKFISPWGTNLEYKYKLDLAENKYKILLIYQNENGKQNKNRKVVGTIDIKEIKELIKLVIKDSTYDLQYKNFSETFTQKNASDFIEGNGDNYWITSKIQREFILQRLTQPEEVENNLKSYYLDYDQSGWIDGSSTEISVSFIVNGRKVSIITKSILEFALPININDKSHFNPDNFTIPDK
jgi:hypothetical protein